MDSNFFPEEDIEEVVVEQNFNQADRWMEQADAIASLMDVQEIPFGWTPVDEDLPDPEFMEQSDDCARILLQELGKL